MTDRVVVLAYAARHGPKAAAQRFGVPVGTIWSWRSRARRQAARQQADRERATGAPAPPPSAQYEDATRRILAWALAASCLRCGGAGLVRLPEVRRGSLLVRRPRTIPCPDCGAPVRRIQVTEWPRREWTEAQRVAGDLGLGWNGAEWAHIRAGQLDPDGRRITGRPDAP